MVTAKFKCTEVTLNKDGEGAQVSLEVVISGSKENESFFYLTPFGKITMGTINLEAAKQFEVGKEYFVNFTKVE